VLQGDGSLWWGGAIQLALEHTVKHGATTDSVVFVNNDTTFGRDFVQSLLDVARAHAPAAVGSVVRDEEQPARLLSIGAGLDIWRLKVRDLLTEPRALDLDAAGVQEVDALSGRGVLFPLEAFRRAGLMRPRWLPHYLADYELSIRVKNAGYRLLVSEKAAVLSANEFGNAHRAKSIREELFSVRSASYLPANLLFWWEASSRLGKLTLLPRLVLRLIWKQLRRKTA
jgi:N-acetylglucosaminyl-diphospho-decaprenol L-rhamnosyltransferase